MRVLIWIVVFVSVAVAQDSLSERTGTHTSPDHVLTACIVPRGERGRADSESNVLIRNRFGKLRAGEDYSSKDHEHGYGVAKAEWTPDSQYFVFLLESSGGHSPMQTPVVFFSRKRNKFFVLDELVNDSVEFGKFEIKAPNRITVS